MLLSDDPGLPADDAHATAQAQTAPGIEQTFSGSLTAMPSEILGVSGAFYVPVYSSVSISQERCGRISR